MADEFPVGRGFKVLLEGCKSGFSARYKGDFIRSGIAGGSPIAATIASGFRALPSHSALGAGDFGFRRADVKRGLVSSFGCRWQSRRERGRLN
jgi:hypothetical protein